LTGFSQGAYDKANAAYNYANTISGGSAADSYARIVANSTAIVANIVAAGLVSTNTNTAIALAGVAAANANITFLTGFSQGAYNQANSANVLAQYAADKANAAYNYANTLSGSTGVDSYARIVANSTAVVANIVAAGLVATNTNTAIALAGVTAANANILFLTGFSQGAYGAINATAIVANSTAVVANQALGISQSTAIVANSTAIVANIALSVLPSMNANISIALAGVSAANSNINFLTGFSQNAFNKANAAYDYANTLSGSTGVDSYARIVANSTAVVANIVAAGLVATNTNTAIALAGVSAANSNISFLIGFSQSAYDKANTGGSSNTSSPISGWTPNAVIFANSTGYLSNTTSFQFYSTNNTGRIAGTLYVGGETHKSALIANGYNQRGGTGYQGFLEVTNEYSSATTPSKFFRLDQAGSIQIRNSGDTQTIFQLTDGGEVTIPSALKSNFIQFGDGSQQWTANAGSGGGGGITITTANTPPASGNVAGDQWYNTDNDTVYEYSTSDGVYYYCIDMVSPTAASTNASTVTGVSAGKAIAYALIFGG
jgi:hypothetical protein